MRERKKRKKERKRRKARQRQRQRDRETMCEDENNREKHKEDTANHIISAMHVHRVRGERETRTHLKVLRCEA